MAIAWDAPVWQCGKNPDIRQGLYFYLLVNQGLRCKNNENRL
jgi:hypothetical protein